MNQLHTQVCFEALSVLNNVQYVESVCNLCGNQHYTAHCPVLRQGTYVPDSPPQSFSRASVPNGLLVMDGESGTCVITSQKFAKGTRFGPLLAEKSYTPIRGVSFPLIIFPSTPHIECAAEFETLFNARNIYLDTTDENKCNWMIHVNTATYSNEQNLICYQENDSIYYAAIQDIELGDILKVWYSPMYASRMGVKLLESSHYDICNNILRQVSMDYGIRIDDNPSYAYHDEATMSEKDRDIALPPVRSLMKITSPNYSYGTTTHTTSHVFDLNTPPPAPPSVVSQLQPSPVMPLVPSQPPFEPSPMYAEAIVPPPIEIKSELMDISMSHSDNGDLDGASEQQDVIKFTCEVCSRKYATKLTLEKHLRTHDLYLCIVCDKLYHSLNEMQDHECYKNKMLRNKTRPLHCHICLKLLSNSWSLTRHMKIHRNEEKTILATPSTSSSSDETPKAVPEEDQAYVIVSEQQEAVESVPVAAPVKPKNPGKRLEEPMECVVCRRPFKNPNALDKHLRFVHTVTTDGTRPVNYSKKYAQETKLKQNSLSNSTTPVKPSIAKALASKLSQKKKMVPEEAQAQGDNTIIIFEVTQLTEDNMYDTNQLLSGAGDPKGTSLPPESLSRDFTSLQPSVISNGTPESSLGAGPSEVLVDVPNMIVLKKGRKGEPSAAFRANSEEILNLDNGLILRNREEALVYNCEDCKKSFAKKHQLKRHQETHDSIYYTCPYCDKAPLKARSSLKKHFSREHNDRIHEWSVSNFISRQVLRDEQRLRELRRKELEKKRSSLNGETIHRALATAADESTSNSTSQSDSLDSLVEDLDNNNVRNGFEPAKRGRPPNLARKFDMQQKVRSATLKKMKKSKTDNYKQPPQQDDHEMIDNLFDNLINDNLLDDPLNGNAYEGDDDQMQSVNYIQQTFQNSFKEIQEKLDADLEVGSEQLKWEQLKSDDSSDEVMSDKLLDENVMLI